MDLTVFNGETIWISRIGEKNFWDKVLRTERKIKIGVKLFNFLFLCGGGLLEEMRDRVV